MPKKLNYVKDAQVNKETLKAALSKTDPDNGDYMITDDMLQAAGLEPRDKLLARIDDNFIGELLQLDKHPLAENQALQDATTVEIDNPKKPNEKIKVDVATGKAKLVGKLLLTIEDTDAQHRPDVEITEGKGRNKVEYRLEPKELSRYLQFLADKEHPPKERTIAAWLVADNIVLNSQAQPYNVPIPGSTELLLFKNETPEGKNRIIGNGKRTANAYKFGDYGYVNDETLITADGDKLDMAVSKGTGQKHIFVMQQFGKDGNKELKVFIAETAEEARHMYTSTYDITKDVKILKSNLQNPDHPNAPYPQIAELTAEQFKALEEDIRNQHKTTPTVNVTLQEFMDKQNKIKAKSINLISLLPLDATYNAATDRNAAPRAASACDCADRANGCKPHLQQSMTQRKIMQIVTLPFKKKNCKVL